MKTGIELIAQERVEQLEKHGFDTNHDVKNNDGYEIPNAVVALLDLDYPDEINEGRPIDKFPINWDSSWCQKMANKTYKERLVIAGALIAAEIDRVQQLIYA